MNPRLKKLVGMLAILAFLAAYVAAALFIAGHLPKNRLVELVYYAVIGIAWGLPLFPLLKWMNR